MNFLLSILLYTTIIIIVSSEVSSPPCSIAETVGVGDSEIVNFQLLALFKSLHHCSVDRRPRNWLLLGFPIFEAGQR